MKQNNKQILYLIIALICAGIIVGQLQDPFCK
jgi:hypothetical protein